MNIKVYKISQLHIIEEEWKRLEKGKDMTFFQTFEWNKCLVTQFKRLIFRRLYRTLKYVVLYDDDGNVICIAPLRIKRLVKKRTIVRCIELLGADSFSDYVNLIYDSCYEEGFSTMMEYIFKRWKKYSIDWRSIPKDSLFADFLINYYKDNTLDFRKCVYIPVEKKDYYSELSKNTRQNFRTSCNRMQRDGLSFRWEIVNIIDEDSLIDKLLEINLERTIEKNSHRFTNRVSVIKEKIRLRYLSIIRIIMGNSEYAWSLIAYLNDDIAGFLTGAYYKDKVYVMMNKVSPQYEFYSPMIVASIQYIGELCQSDSDIKIVDFGRGTESYKYRLGGEEADLIKFSYNL